MILHMSNTINYYIATLRLSDDMIDYKTITTNSGYSVRVAKCSDGSVKAQSILFPKEKYNIAQASIVASMLSNIWI